MIYKAVQTYTSFGWIIMCLILPSAVIRAQSTNTDSLRKVWYQQGATYSDAQRLEAGFELVAFYAKQNYDSLQYFSYEMEAYGRRSKNRKWIMYGLFGRAEVFRLVGNLDSTISSYHRALKYVASEEEEELIVAIYCNMGEQYQDMNRPDSAVYYFTKALKVADKYQHYTYVGKLFGNFGQFYYTRGDYLKALKLWERGLKHSSTSSQKIFRLLDIGSLLEEMGLTEDARTYLQRALQLATTFAEDPSIQVNVYSVLLKTAPDRSTFERLLKKGTLLSDSFKLNFPKQRLFESAAKVYLDAQQLTLAEYYLDRLYDMPWVVKTNRGIGASVLLARLEHQKQQYRQSIQTCRAILAKIGETQFVKERIAIYNLLYQNYLSLKNTENALLYLQKRVDLEAQLNQSVLIRTTIGTYLKEKGKLEQTALQQDKAIAELKLQSTLSRSRMNNWVFGLVSALLCTIAMAALYFSRQKQQVANQLMSINSTLEQEQQKLKAANARLLRFSGVVSHDILSNLDLILSTGNVLVGSKPNANSLNQYYTMTQTTSRQLKDYCLGLLAEARSLPKEDLAAEEWADPMPVLHRVLARFGPELRAARVEIDLQELSPAPLSAVLMEQVFQNLISNTIRYGATAHQPRLLIRENLDRRGRIQWIIEDNGVGISPEQREDIFAPNRDRSSWNGVGQHLGLSQVRASLRDQGGDIVVETGGAGGVRWVVNMPDASCLVLKSGFQ